MRGIGILWYFYLIMWGPRKIRNIFSEHWKNLENNKVEENFQFFSAGNEGTETGRTKISILSRFIRLAPLSRYSVRVTYLTLLDFNTQTVPENATCSQSLPEQPQEYQTRAKVITTRIFLQFIYVFIPFLKPHNQCYDELLNFRWVLRCL